MTVPEKIKQLSDIQNYYIGLKKKNPQFLDRDENVKDIEAIDYAIKNIEAWEELKQRLPQMAQYQSSDGQDLVMVADIYEFIKEELGEYKDDAERRDS